MFIFNISCLVYCKRGTGSFTLDCVHTSLGCPTMFAEGEKQVFIINVRLSCLPSCLYLHYCEQLERLLFSRVESLTSPGASLLRKKIINSPLAKAKCCPEGEGESQRAQQQQRRGRGLGAAGSPPDKQELRGRWYHKKDGSRSGGGASRIWHLPPGTAEATAGGMTLCRRWRQSGGNPEEERGKKVKGLANTTY